MLGDQVDYKLCIRSKYVGYLCWLVSKICIAIKWNGIRFVMQIQFSYQVRCFVFIYLVRFSRVLYVLTTKVEIKMKVNCWYSFKRHIPLRLCKVCLHSDTDVNWKWWRIDELSLRRNLVLYRLTKRTTQWLTFPRKAYVDQRKCYEIVVMLWAMSVVTSAHSLIL